MDISYAFVRILKSVGLKPYRPRPILGLLEDDPDRWLQFSEIMLNEIEENPMIVWTDEASFKLTGHVNRHNCVYWHSENMHLRLETQLGQPGVSGVVFQVLVFKDQYSFDGSDTGNNYLKIIINELSHSHNNSHIHMTSISNKMEPPHYSRAILEYIDETFPQKRFN